ncbi:MAG: DNA polymerase III subunit delta [Clostridia bacterium]|nr:DNA polymerase III subunit delta [Clostridia bacterium]
MNWNEFYQAINANEVSGVYLFTGPEEYIKREALDALRNKILPPGLEQLNDTTLEGVTAQQITDAAETMPMMCEKRILTVRDWAPLLPAKSKNEDAEVEWMQKWLDNPPDSCILIFYMRSEPDGRKKMNTLLKKKATIVKFDLLTDPELNKWCAGRLKPLGKKITVPAISSLTFMAGRELTRLCGELDKLTAYTGDRKEITPEDVKAIVSASLEYNVFELMNALLASDLHKAQSTVNSILQGGQNPVGILAMLTRQIRQMTHMKCALDSGTPVQTVQEQLKMHPFAAKQTANQVRKLPSQWLANLYAACVETDFEIKSGRLRDQAALDGIMLKIALASRGN